MSTGAPMVVVCEVHGFEVRYGVNLPCPWPRCAKGTEVSSFMRRKPGPVTWADDDEWNDERFTETVTSGPWVYERRCFVIAGDGARSRLWYWMKRA